ncbi:MAG: hypothetical protein ACE5GN_06650 [Waddliaceae bacterium]
MAKEVDRYGALINMCPCKAKALVDVLSGAIASQPEREYYSIYVQLEENTACCDKSCNGEELKKVRRR